MALVIGRDGIRMIKNIKWKCKYCEKETPHFYEQIGESRTATCDICSNKVEIIITGVEWAEDD